MMMIMMMMMMMMMTVVVGMTDFVKSQQLASRYETLIRTYPTTSFRVLESKSKVKK